MLLDDSFDLSPFDLYFCFLLHKYEKAGNIKCHMISERTIVVESNATDITTTMMTTTTTTRQNEKFLDEGSLLLVKLDQQTIDSSSSNETNETIVNNTNQEWKQQLSRSRSNEGYEFSSVIPLGKILEVFGPVSKPLYTVRLLLSILLQLQL